MLLTNRVLKKKNARIEPNPLCRQFASHKLQRELGIYVENSLYLIAGKRKGRMARRYTSKYHNFSPCFHYFSVSKKEFMEIVEVYTVYY